MTYDTMAGDDRNMNNTKVYLIQNRSAIFMYTRYEASCKLHTSGIQCILPKLFLDIFSRLEFIFLNRHFR